MTPGCSLKYVKENDKVEKKIVINELKKVLGLNEWENNPKIDDNNIKDVLSDFWKQIFSTIEEIIEGSNRNKSNFNTLTKLLTKHEKEYDCDLNYFLKSDFEKDLSKDKKTSWGKNIFLAQALMLSYAYHSNQLAGYYTKDIENRILEIMDKDIKKLKEILNS